LCCFIIYWVDEAIKAYLKSGQYQIAANLYKDKGEIEKAIKTLLLDAQGMSLPDALQLALDYTSSENGLSLDPGCSVDVIAQRAAEFYIQNGDIKNAVKCAEHFTETRDKVSLFKKAGFKDEVLEILNKDKKYDDMYRLYKGWEWFERGAEVAERLENSKTHCEFLLFIVKKKLLCEQEYSEENKLKDAEILQNAGKSLTFEDLKLLMQLFCAKLKKNSIECIKLCKKFIDLKNHFGAIEALNAAFIIKQPNLDLNECSIATVLDKISLVIDTAQYAQDIINRIHIPGMLTEQLSKCRIFYQFEQSDDTYYSPPSQFYWIPSLSEICKSQDCDGMIQFDKLVLHQEIQRHFNVMIDHWLEIKPEKVIFDAMKSKKYHSLNSTFDNYTNFAETCSKCSGVQEYLCCCIKLVEIASFHIDNERKGKCGVDGKDWMFLRNYGSKRIHKMFSSQWCYYLPFSRKEVEMVMKSKSVCECMLSKLKPRDEVKQDINSFLFNWRICKLTNRSLELELKTCLEEEETKWNEIIKLQKETNDKERKDSNKAKEKSKKEACKENPKKDNIPEEVQEILLKHNHTPGVLIEDKKSGQYSHGFLNWLKYCKMLEGGNFIGFAEGVIKKLLFLIIKRKSIKYKIKVLDLISLLEVICTGLLGSLQVANVIENLSIILPESYEHAIKAFDSINSPNCAILNSVANSISEKDLSKKVFYLSLHLLQKVLQLLLGELEQSSSNVLRHAASHHTTVINNGFERCLGLCLCLFGNLFPLIRNEEMCFLYQKLCDELNSMLKYFHDIPETHPLTSCFPGLPNIVNQFNTMQSFYDSFVVLATIQQHYNHSMVSLNFHSKDKLFTFKRISHKEFVYKPPPITHEKCNPHQSHKQAVLKKPSHHVGPGESQQNNSSKPYTQTKAIEQQQQVSSKRNIPMNYKAAVEESNTSNTEKKVDVLEQAEDADHGKLSATTDCSQLDAVLSLPTSTLHPQQNMVSIPINLNKENVQENTASFSTDSNIDKYNNAHVLSQQSLVEQPKDVTVSIAHYSTPPIEDSGHVDVLQGNKKEGVSIPSSNSTMHSDTLKDEAESSTRNESSYLSVPEINSKSQVSSTKQPPGIIDNVAVASKPHDAIAHTMHQQFMQQPHSPPSLQYAQSQDMFTQNVTQGFWQSPEMLVQWQNMALQHQQSTNPYFQQPNFISPQMMMQYSQMMQYNQMMQMSMGPALLTDQYYPVYSTNAQSWFHYHNDTYQIQFDDDDETLFDEDKPSENISVANINYCPTCNTSINPKDNHLESPEHRINLQYCNTLNKYEPIIEKAKQILQSSSDLLRLQISKIGDCLKKYNIEKCTIESEGLTVSLNRVQTLDNIGSEISTLLKGYDEQLAALENHQKN